MQGHGGEKQQLGADTSFLVTGAGTSRHVRAPLGLRGVPRLCSRVSPLLSEAQTLSGRLRGVAEQG